MTRHRDFKAIIRTRMAETGQSYTSARVRILHDRRRLFGIVENDGSVPRRPQNSPANAANAKGNSNFNIVGDPRCEFMVIMGRLAGYFECCSKRPSVYAAEVDAQFSAFKRHPAVQTLERLKQNRGFEAWYLLQFGIRLSDITRLDEVLQFEAPHWDPAATWTLEELSDFRDELRDFAVEADVPSFLLRNADLYEEAARRLRATIDTTRIGNWLKRFHRARGRVECFLVPALLMPRCRSAAINEFSDGRIELFGFLGSRDDLDERGIPNYSSRPLSIGSIDEVPLLGRCPFAASLLDFHVIEVFCRMTIRAEVSIHEASLRIGSEETFAVTEPEITAALRRCVDYQFPASSEREPWHSMMSGTLSMAIFSQYLRCNGGEAAARQLMRWYQTDALVFWRQPLFELFEEFENNRELYPRLGDFMPRVAAFFVECAARIKQPGFLRERQQALQSVTSKSPQIKRSVPPHGATDVDPDLAVLTVEFDRAMSGDWGFLGLPDGKFPRMDDPPSFDETVNVFSLPVSLEPDTHYALLLNSHHFLGFADADGNHLIPTPYYFRTGPKRVDG